MSISYAFVAAGIPVQDLPRCHCGGDFVQFSVDVEAEGRKVFLVGHTVCGECGFEPDFFDCGTDAKTWREAVFRCVNGWSAARGGVEYPLSDFLPDQLEELVEYVEGQFGPLPEYRAKVLARHVLGLH